MEEIIKSIKQDLKDFYSEAKEKKLSLQAIHEAIDKMEITERIERLKNIIQFPKEYNPFILDNISDLKKKFNLVDRDLTQQGDYNVMIGNEIETLKRRMGKIEKKLETLNWDVENRTCNALLSHMNEKGRPDEHGLGKIKEELKRTKKVLKNLLYYWATKDICWEYKDEKERRNDMNILLKEIEEKEGDR